MAKWNKTRRNRIEKMKHDGTERNRMKQLTNITMKSLNMGRMTAGIQKSTDRHDIT